MLSFADWFLTGVSVEGNALWKRTYGCAVQVAVARTERAVQVTVARTERAVQVAVARTERAVPVDG